MKIEDFENKSLSISYFIKEISLKLLFSDSVNE